MARRVIKVARSVLDLRWNWHWRKSVKPSVAVRDNCIAATSWSSSVVVCRISAAVWIHVRRLVNSDQRFVRVQLLVQFGVAVFPFPRVYEEERRYRTDQQLWHNDKDDPLSEAHMVVQDATNKWTDKGAKCKSGRPETGHKSVRLNTVREAVFTGEGDE